MRKLMMGTLAACMAVGLAPAHLASAQKAQPSAPPAGAPQPSTTPGAQPKTPTAMMPTAKQVLDDVNQTFGFVPQFIRAFPDALLPGFWASLKGLQMNPNTSLDGKTKELIGLAVASQIPCEFCVYFHTAAARGNGATDQEIKEAIGMAAVTRFASTQLNGAQLDKAQFKKDADRIMKEGGRGRQQAKAP
jgi:AhpD family alkylhydroperoxidase